MNTSRPNKTNGTRKLRWGWVPLLLLALLRPSATQAGVPSGRFLEPGPVAPIAAPPDADPLFGRWLVGRKTPIVCRFSAAPNTPYRVFIGLSEAHWDRAGQRLMDLEVAGRVVATVDSFQKAKGTPSGYLFSVTTDARGRLDVRVCPHPGAPDQNTVVCGVLLFPANAALEVDAIIHHRGPKPLVAVVAGDSMVAGQPVDHFAHARFVNHRVDNDLVAGLGTCQVDDFRFFTMLHQEAWDFLRWETMGNAVQDHRTWRNWPYEQHLRVQVDGADVSTESARNSATVESVEQQFDFRQVTVSAPAVNIERLDMTVSARQWTTALRLTNRMHTPAKVVVAVEWTTRNEAPLEVRPWSDGESQGFAYSLKDGPPILVAVGARGTWEKQGEAAVGNRWEVTLKPDEAVTLDMNAHIGWAAMPAYRDNGPGTCATVRQAIVDRRADRDGFQRVMAALGVSAFGEQWSDLQKMCEAKRHYVHDRMPRLHGFDPEWDGMWCYAFDLMRSAMYPAQGNFKDVWMVTSLDVYREPFYWDGPATMHSFCHWDADLAARMMRTFWSSMKPDGTVCVSANPYRAFDNPTPQLANLTMALWDCYQITHDQAMLASFYPQIVQHVRWLETQRNRTPKGPLMDVGYNIDYGPPQLYSSPTLWPDVQFFLVDRYRRLSKMAAVLGRPQTEVDEWSGKAERLADGIRKHMWDDKVGTFWCVSDKMDFKPVPSPIEFHGLVAEVPTREQARRLLVRLHDPAKYAPNEKHPYGLPSAPFDSPLFVVKDSWSGTIWPIQTYYTVRGLVNYGYQDEAAALSANLYGMMARDYLKTGSIWEQYDPLSGQDLSHLPSAKYAGNDVGRGYFTSGITTSVFDMLLRGLFGFERTDDPAAFYLTPTPLATNWHGIEKLPLSGPVRLSIQMKKDGPNTACQVRFSGLGKGLGEAAIYRVHSETGVREPVARKRLDPRGAVELLLESANRSRYLWEIR